MNDLNYKVLLITSQGLSILIPVFHAKKTPLVY